MRYTLDELLLRKFRGWKAEEFIFLSVLGELSFLRDYPTLERRNDYSGVRDMAVIVIAGKNNPTEGYAEAEKLIEKGAGTVGMWVLGEPKIYELSFNGHRPKNYGTVFLSQDWQNIVNRFAEAA